jgi:Tfp pilus assembly protein PilX
MKRVKNKSKRILAELLWGESGFSVMVVIFAMLVLTVIGYSMTRMMATKQKSVPVNAQSSSAFYVAEGGLNYAGKYRV